MLLTAVASVCDIYISALPQIPQLIDCFLFAVGSDWTLESATVFGSVRLLDRLKSYEWSGVDQSFREARFDAAIATAIRKVDTEVLDWWLAVYLPERAADVMPTMMALACKSRQLAMLQWLHKRGYLDTLENSVEVVCKTREIADWLYELGNDKITVTYRVKFSSDEDAFTLLQSAISRGIPYLNPSGYRSVADDAAASGHMEALQWIIAEGVGQCSASAINIAIRSGHSNVAKWLYAHYARGYFEELTRGCSDLATAQWVLSEYNWSSEFARNSWIREAIANSGAFAIRRLDVAEYLFMACPEADEGEAIEAAATHGDLHLIQRLSEHGARSTPDAMETAAFRGHLDVLRWLHEFRNENCTEFGVNLAAQRGHLDVIQWLDKNNPECFTSAVMDDAAGWGHLEVVKWLHHNRSEGCTTKAVDAAAGRGYLDVIKWLHEHRSVGCTPNAITRAAGNGQLTVLMYLRETFPALTCLPMALDSATRSGHLKVIQFLLQRYELSLSSNKIQSLLHSKNFGAAEWVMKTGALS